MTRYLLGQLPEAERDVREQEWFTNKVQYSELCEAENSLIDEYVRGDLSGTDRVLFEQHFLTIPARRERVQTARALMQEIDHRVIETPSPFWWQRWLEVWRAPKLLAATTMMIAFVLIAVGLWAVWQRRELREQLAGAEQKSSEQQRRVQALEQSLAAERDANNRLTEELSRTQALPQITPPTASPALPSTLLFTLTAGMLRSENNETLPTLKLTKGVERVQLRVQLPAHDYARWAATLRTAAGHDVTRWPTIKAATSKQGTASLLLPLAAKTLKAGDYVVVVSGIKASRELEEFRRLPFRVSQ